MPGDAAFTDAAAGSLTIRLLRVVAGTVVMGFAIAVLVTSAAGLLPLDVLHRAVAERAGWTIGTAIIALQSLLLVLNLSLGIRPGIGTIASVVIPAVVADALLIVLPAPHAVWARALGLVVGGALFAVGTATYLAARLGSLPRDGLMFAIEQNSPWGLARIRVGADLTCLGCAVLLVNPADAVRTGSLGIGSVLLAVTLGPAIGRLLPLVSGRRPLVTPEGQL